MAYLNMNLGNAIIIIGVALVIALSGNYILGSSIARDLVHVDTSSIHKPTLALAPISLGNPSTALGPETSSGLRPAYSKPTFGSLKRVVEQPFIMRKGDTLATILSRAGVRNQNSYLAMTAHILYKSIDNKYSATHSPKIIKIIRNKIGYKNLIMTDDISMKALKLGISKNTTQAFKAGCNLVLHCNGNYKEMLDVAENSPKVDEFIIKKTSQLINIIR